MKKTILREIVEKGDKAIAILRLVTEKTADAYESGEVTLDNAFHIICAAGKRADVEHRLQAYYVGSALLRCFSANPQTVAPRRGPKGAPTWHREVAVAGIEWAKQTGGVIDRNPLSGRPSCFVIIADYLTGVGLATTAAQVEKWYSNRNKNSS